jgi:hypothetical protein
MLLLPHCFKLGDIHPLELNGTTCTPSPSYTSLLKPMKIERNGKVVTLLENKAKQIHDCNIILK